MKNLPMWMQGFLMIPYSIGMIYVSQMMMTERVEVVVLIGFCLLFIGYLILTMAVPTIYFGLLPHLITSQTQRKATKALTGTSEPVIRSVMFVTGIFFCVIGLELKYVSGIINGLEHTNNYYIFLHNLSQFLGWSVPWMIALTSRSLILFGLGLVAYKIGRWVISKFKRRPTIAMPQAVRTAPRHDAFADIRGYDD